MCSEMFFSKAGYNSGIAKSFSVHHLKTVARMAELVDAPDSKLELATLDVA